MPAGEYKALKIIIGEGSGEKLVVCYVSTFMFVDEEKGIIDKDTDDKLREVLTEEEYNLIAQKLVIKQIEFKLSLK